MAIRVGRPGVEVHGVREVRRGDSGPDCGEGWRRDIERKDLYAVDAAGAALVPDVDPSDVGGAVGHGTDKDYHGGRRIGSTRRRGRAMFPEIAAGLS